jgi:hypothetical protein
MKLFDRSLAAIFMSFGMAVTGALVANAALAAPVAISGTQDYPAAGPYPAPYVDLRGLVDRTQNDLRTAAELEREKPKEYERYHDAQGHLSTFDRHLTKGHFDKGELNKSIDSIRSILDHNVLQASSRDALMRDEADLKVARDRHW